MIGISLTVLGGCAPTNQHLTYPREAPAQVVVWSADFSRDQLLVHVEGARPPGPGPFPTLLVHPEESERMAERLIASRDTMQLLVVPGAGRLFNFRQAPQARLAWDATLEWLDRYLRPTPPTTDEPRLGRGR